MINGMFSSFQQQDQQWYDYQKMARQQQYNKENMAIQQGYNERNMELQNQYAIDAEKRANAYNDPSAQLARVKMAGLNPQAVVSDAGVQGSISSAPSGGSPSGGSPSGGVPMANPINAKMDILGSILSLKKTESDISNQTNVADSQADLNYALADRARGQEGRDKESWQDTLRAIKADADNKENQAAISRFDANIKAATFGNDIVKSSLEVQKMVEDIKRSKEQGEINEQQAKLLIASISQKWAEAWYIEEKAITENQSRDANIENTKSQTAKNKAETKTIDETREVTILNLLGELGIKQVNMRTLTQKLNDLKLGLDVRSSAGEFVRFLSRRLGISQTSDGYDDSSYYTDNFETLFAEFVKEMRKKYGYK